MKLSQSDIDQRTAPYYVLGPERFTLLGDILVRLNKDLLKAVVFVGYMRNDENGEEVFIPGGTAFYLQYEYVAYLVTARHVAEALHPPFFIRATSTKGEPLLEGIRGAEWFVHPDENVDLAIGVGALEDAQGIGSNLILTKDLEAYNHIGIGDEVHVVGLYRLLHGKKRNLPIVHSGNLAMVPEYEPIPQIDRTTKKRRLVECYVVEIQSLEGLSGSPVFVRSAYTAKFGGKTVLLSSGPGFLLGVWSGAWDAPPGEVLASEYPKALKVPVGMGLVVPAYKLKELLEQPDVVKHRKGVQARLFAAKQDSALPDKNPKHKEDFSHLLDKAVKEKKPKKGK